MVNETKRLLKEFTEESSELPLMPMIDVVFQLLIFFLFAMKFSGREGRLYAKLPVNKGIAEDSATAEIFLPQVRIKLLWVYRNDWRRRLQAHDYQRLRVDSAHRFWWIENGMVVLKIRDRYLMRGRGADARPDWDELFACIERAKRRFRPTRNHKTLPVIIEAYPLVPFQYVVTALNFCIKANIKNVEFAVFEKMF